jgi:YD repeat-containing protein
MQLAFVRQSRMPQATQGTNSMRAGKCHVAFAFIAALIASGCASEDRDIAKLSSTSGEAPKLRYAYDPLGRLVQAVASDGTAVQYSYDAVGNITAVRRLAGGALRIVDFVPPAGAIGSTVAVYGAGFSATPSENTVAFNGTAATVTAATPTALTVSVPSGATTGKITVTSGGGSATSSADYMVLSSSASPGISSFTPLFGNQGTVVSVTGINFQTHVVDDKVSLGRSGSGRGV